MSKVVVTCGGTSEAVDDVRVLSNVSTGRFGHALAAELAKYTAYEVTELCPKSTLERLGHRRRVVYKHYRTTDELRSLLLDGNPPAIVLQAAAVADYRPTPVAGKIPSDSDEMTITLEKVPKILSELRPAYGSKTFLVGFKLLSNVSEEELIAAASAQLKANRLNMVIANDLHNLKDNRHPVVVITAEGGAIPFDGTRDEVAAELAAFIHKRERVNWFQSGKSLHVTQTPDLAKRFDATLEGVKAMNLLTDASGNISVRSSDYPASLMVSPRGVDKSKLQTIDALAVSAILNERKIYFSGDGKPSIDTGMEALLYDRYSNLDAIIHFHRGWGKMDATTAFPYPCGVEEEAVEVIRSLDELGIGSAARAFGAELVHHGFILGLTMSELERILGEWRVTRDEFQAHLDELATNPANPTAALDDSLYRPIWNGAEIKGIIYDDPEAAIVYLRTNARGSGVGRKVIDQLIQRRYTIQTVDDCRVRDFYKKFGFIETVDGDYFRLKAPHLPLERKF